MQELTERECYRFRVMELISNKIQIHDTLDEDTSVCWKSTYETLERFFSYYSTDLIEHGWQLLSCLIDRNHYQLVTILLDDSRIGLMLTDLDKCKRLIYSAVSNAGSSKDTRIIKAVLQDRRATPTASHLIRAAERNDSNTIDLLLNDGRIDVNSLDLIQVCTVTRNCGFLVGRLLADSRYNAKAQGEALLLKLAGAYGEPTLLKILLSDQRIDPTIADNTILRRLIKWSGRDVNLFWLLLSDKRVGVEKVNEESSIAITIMRHDVRGARYSQSIEVEGSTYNYTELACVTAMRLIIRCGRIDLNANDNEALKVAKELDIPSCIKMLELCKDGATFDPMTL